MEAYPADRSGFTGSELPPFGQAAARIANFGGALSANDEDANLILLKN